MRKERKQTYLYKTTDLAFSSRIFSVVAVVLFLLCLSGCGEPPESAVPRAVEKIPIEKIENPEKELLVPALEAKIIDVFERYDPDTILRILAECYQEAPDSVGKAKAVAALHAFARSRCPPELRDSVMAFAREALTEGDSRIRYLALRVMKLKSDYLVRTMNAQAIMETLDEITEPHVAFDAYDLLMYWGFTKPVVDQLMVPAPEDPESEAYRIWKTRTSAALLASAGKLVWTRTGLPQGVVDRLLELALEQEEFTEMAIDVFLSYRATEYAGPLRKVYNRLELGRQKVLVGTALTVIHPNDKELFAEVLSAVKEMLEKDAALAEKDFPFGGTWSFLLTSAVKAESAKRAREIWEAFNNSSPCQRSSVLNLLTALFGHREGLILDILQSTSDPDLRAMLEAELQDAEIPGILLWLKTDNLPGGKLPQLSPRRRKVLRRVQGLLDEVKRNQER